MDYYRSQRDSYRWRTHRPVNSLLLVAPLLLVFHAGSASVEAPLFATRDLARILGVFGSTAWYLPPLLVAAVLLIQHAVRRDRWRFEGGVLAGMVVESVLWALPLLAINYLCSLLLSAGGALGAQGDASTVSALQAVGAGVYEEFVFRLLLLGLVTWIFTNVLEVRKRKDWVTLIVLVASSLAFSLYHFSWPADAAGVAFNWGDFTWRAAAGVCLGLIYATRGFGIAVGAHVTWNLYVVLLAAT